MRLRVCGCFLLTRRPRRWMSLSLLRMMLRRSPQSDCCGSLVLKPATIFRIMSIFVKNAKKVGHLLEKSHFYTVFCTGMISKCHAAKKRLMQKNIKRHNENMQKTTTGRRIQRPKFNSTTLDFYLRRLFVSRTHT